MTKLIYIPALLLFSITVFSRELTINQLSQMIFDQKNNIKTVEDVLPRLPRALLTNYVLMIDSKSLQAATPENPRVIMFGKDDEIMISFNGGAMGKGDGGPVRGANSIEAIEYNSKTKSSDLVEYTFGQYDEKEKTYKSNAYVTEVRNPRKCAGCHGDVDRRPIWNPYPVWPGALPQAVRLTDGERTYMEDFVKRGAGHSRYQHLFRRENLSAMVNIPLETSMASRMDEGLLDQRRTRFVKLLRGTPDFEKFKYAFMGALGNCDMIEEFVPSPLRQELDSRGTKLQHATAVSNEVTQLAPLHTLFHSGMAGAQVMGNFTWLLENRGIDLTFWTTAFPAPHLFTTVPEVFYPPVIEALNDFKYRVPTRSLSAILLHHEGQLAILNETDVAAQKKFCEDMKVLSLRQF